jgi:hypothetical protein
VADIAVALKPAFVLEASLRKHPDRSHLAAAIHFMDLIDLADEELPAARATVECSKAAAATARGELDKHQEWLGQHQELYTEAVKGCERRLKRQAFIGACKEAAWLPIQLVATASTGLLHSAHAHAIELYLKAFLRLRGFGPEEVKSSFGHDFKKLVDEASSRGLSLGKEEIDIAAILTEQESIRRSRYIETGYYQQPGLPALSRTCQGLDQSVSAALRDAGLSIQSSELNHIEAD